jgi:kinesin family protein 2/24
MISNNIPKSKISKIRVVVRKRPANHREFAQNDIDIITTEGKNTIIVKELKNKVDLTKYIEEHKFTFDRAYGDISSNQMIYNEMLKPMIEAAFNKTKITCFAFGQTGSGKTYTMLGNNHIKNDNGPQVPGLYLLSCIDMFNLLKKKEYSNLELWVSFYEIYCNKLFDLLNNKNILQAREDGKGNICIVGLIEKHTKNIEELLDIIDFGLNSRTVGITGANLDSSRSHGILQIVIKTRDKEVYSKISFIDLAGSERAVDTIDTNKRTKIDGAEINKSLLALKECIRALDLEKRHKPFRGSKLTLVLRDSFIGNCLTLMIANISPCLSCSEHTLNTLRYADRVKELRKPRHEKENENNKSNNYNNVIKSKKTKESELLAELLMMPRNNGPNIKYNVEIKTNNGSSPDNLIMNHGYNFMKIKTKNNQIELNKDIDIQKPDKNILKIDDIIKNEKIPQKYNFRKNRNSSEKKNNQIINNLISNISNEKENALKEIKYQNYQRVKVNKDINKDEISADDYVSKYSNYEIKNDEELQKISMIHEELINSILKEEDVFIREHKKHIDDMVESIKDEMDYIHEVDKPGSNIEEYTSNLDKLLYKEIQIISQLRKRLNKFRIMLKDESALAHLFEDEEEIILGADEGFDKNSQKSIESFDLNKDLTEKNENNKQKFKFKKNN